MACVRRYYAVAIDQNLFPTLSDPVPSGSLASALVSQGGSLSGVTITFSTANQTIQGWDFSLHGGFKVQLNANNITFQNNKNSLGTNNASVNALVGVASNASGIVIQKNDLNGNSIVNSGAGFGLVGNNGLNTIIRYNYIRSAFSECIVYGCDATGGGTQTIQYNVIQDAGLGFNSGAHGDWIQNVVAASCQCTSGVFDFNVWLQTVPIATGRTQGITFPDAGNGVVNWSIQNNCFIGQSGSFVNWAANVFAQWYSGVATVQSNYIDNTGINSTNGGGGGTLAGWLVTDSQGAPAGPFAGTLVYGGNLSLLTGATAGHS
jgi:hypothetical protein